MWHSIVSPSPSLSAVGSEGSCSTNATGADQLAYVRGSITAAELPTDGDTARSERSNVE